jgi:hypothetical protein
MCSYEISIFQLYFYDNQGFRNPTLGVFKVQNPPMNMQNRDPLILLNVERIARCIYKLVVGHVTKHTLEVSGTGRVKHKTAISQGSLPYIYSGGGVCILRLVERRFDSVVGNEGPTMLRFVGIRNHEQ